MPNIIKHFREEEDKNLIRMGIGENVVSHIHSRENRLLEIFEGEMKRQFGSLKHQVCERGLTIDDIITLIKEAR